MLNTFNCRAIHILFKINEQQDITLAVTPKSLSDDRASKRETLSNSHVMSCLSFIYNLQLIISSSYVYFERFAHGF